MRLRNECGFIGTLLTGAVLFLLSTLSASAQFGIRVPIEDAASGSSSSAPRRALSRNPSVQKANYRVEIRKEIVRISNLTVTTEAGAKVALLSLERNAKVRQPIIADRDGNAIFDNLSPGRYRITASKEGFETLEQESINILPKKPHGLNLSLRTVTYKLTIATNLKGGEVRYAPAIKRGTDKNGSILSTETGNKCFVRIGNTGEAVVSDLKEGYYNLDIIPDALEYERTLLGVDVPENTDREESGKSKTIRIEVKTKISTGTFGAAWTEGEWSLPTGWTLNKGLKVVDSNGAAFPQNEQYRYYADFEMVSDVKLRETGSVGFAFRAQDENSFYLLQISGPDAPERNVAKFLIVQDGIPKQLSAISIVGFAETVSSKNGFRLTVAGKDNQFRISIEDSDTGKLESVGIVTDRDSTFRKGAVGIVASGASRFEVSYFQICSSKCN